MIPAKGNGMDIREGKDDIAVRAIPLALCRPLTRFSCSIPSRPCSDQGRPTVIFLQKEQQVVS
jgi:hypothetical protein